MELRELQQHIRNLVTVERTAAPVVSCYIDVEGWRLRNRQSLEKRLKAPTHEPSNEARRALDDALARIEAFLREDRLTQASGAAVFARAGDRPIFIALQFRVRLPDRVAVDSVPHIYPLVELKHTYHRYVVMLSTERRARIMTIHAGSIVQDISIARPELRQAVGREWAKERRNDRRARIDQFIHEQIQTVDRVFTAGGYRHLILAGSPHATARVSNALPARLAAKLIDFVPASEYDKTKDVVEATLACFVEREEQESLAKVDKLLQETGRHGFAVAGTRASLAALSKGQVDVLVLDKGFQPEPGWSCGNCGVIDAGTVFPAACPGCGARPLRRRYLKEDMVRLAEGFGSEVEIVNHSDALMRLGGVGCLLRFLQPESYVAKAA